MKSMNKKSGNKMPKKGYKQTKEHKKNISKGNKGNKQTEETKQKIREKKLKYHKDNPGCIAGENNPNFGVLNENTPIFKK